MRIVFPYTTRELEITWAELFKNEWKVELAANIVVDNESHFFDA